MTQYELLRANESLLRTMIANGVIITDVLVLDMVREAEAMTRAGEKKNYIVEYLGEKYGYTRRSVFSILSRLNNPVTI